MEARSPTGITSSTGSVRSKAPWGRYALGPTPTSRARRRPPPRANAQIPRRGQPGTTTCALAARRPRLRRDRRHARVSRDAARARPRLDSHGPLRVPRTSSLSPRRYEGFTRKRLSTPSPTMARSRLAAHGRSRRRASTPTSSRLGTSGDRFVGSGASGDDVRGSDLSIQTGPCRPCNASRSTAARDNQEEYKKSLLRRDDVE